MSNILNIAIGGNQALKNVQERIRKEDKEARDKIEAEILRETIRTEDLSFDTLPSNIRAKQDAETYKLGYQETSGYNKLKSKLDATNELRKKVFDANLQNKIMNPEDDEKDQYTFGQFLLKRSTQNELDKVNFELDLGLFKQKGKGAFFEESAKEGFFSVKDSKDLQRQKINQEAELLELKKEKGIDDISQEVDKTRAVEEEKYEVEIENKLKSKANKDLVILEATENNNYALDLSTIAGVELAEGDPDFFVFKTASDKTANLTNSASRISHYEDVIMGLMKLDQNIWDSLQPKGSEQTRLKSILGQAMTGIYREKRQLKKNELGEDIFVETEEPYNFNDGIIGWDQAPEWLKDSAQEVLTPYSSSESGTPTITKNGMTENKMVPEFTEALMAGFYGNLDEGETVDTRKGRHTKNLIKVAALIPEDGVLRSQKSIEENQSLLKQALTNGDNPDYKLSIRAVDALGGYLFKGDSVDLKSTRLTIESKVRQRAISTLNEYAFLDAYEAAQENDFYSEKGGGVLLVDPRDFYDTKFSMYASMFNIRNLTTLKDVQVETVEGKFIPLVGIPKSSQRQTGKKVISYSNYIKHLEDGGFGVFENHVKQSAEALSFGDKAIDTGYFLLRALDDFGSGSALATNAVTLINGIKSFAPELINVITGTGTADNNVDQWMNSFHSDRSLNNIYTRLNQYVADGVKEGKYTEKNAASLRKATNNLQLLLFGNNKDSQGKNRRLFQDGLNDIKKGNFKSAAARAARLKIAQVSFVFQAAAALQGEGGKAISDGDRKFVEDGASYSTFSTVNQRKEAIGQFIRVIAKANSINRAIGTAAKNNDVAMLHAALTFNERQGGVGGTILNHSQENQLINSLGARGLMPSPEEDINIPNIPDSNENMNQGVGVFPLGSSSVRISKGDSIKTYEDSLGWKNSSQEQKDAIIKFLQGEK